MRYGRWYDVALTCMEGSEGGSEGGSEMYDALSTSLRCVKRGGGKRGV